MTRHEFRAARFALGLSLNECASLLHVAGRTVRRWEDGQRDIPGPAQVLMKALVERRLPKLHA